MDLVVSFDVTGSMSPCIAQVRNNIKSICKYLFSKVPDLRIGIIAHGDYCDGYKCMAKMPFTSDLPTLENFINKNHVTHGGDADECYEYALNQAKTFDWRMDVPRTIILIGDAAPHSESYGYQYLKQFFPSQKHNYSWSKEAQDLINLGISIYPVRCLNSKEPFYQQLADLNTEKVPVIELANFQNSGPILIAISMAKMGRIGEFETEVLADGTYSNEVIGSIRALKEAGELNDADVFDPFKDAVGGISIVTAEVKKNLKVEQLNISPSDGGKNIKQFIESKGLPYSPRSTFYNVKNPTRRINSKTSVITKDRKTGEFGETVISSNSDLKSLLSNNLVYISAKSPLKVLSSQSKVVYKHS